MKSASATDKKSRAGGLSKRGTGGAGGRLMEKHMVILKKETEKNINK